MTRLHCGGLALAMLTCAACVRADAQPRALNASAFGVVGDGMTDDGPAIQRLLAAASNVDGPVELRFPSGKTFRVRTAPDRYVFRLHATSDVTLDGGGSAFLLDPHIRFMSLIGSANTTVRRLSVDFDPLPFVDGEVIATNAERRTLDARLVEGAEVPVGGPTLEDGEQAFFAMLWHDGPYGTVSHHCWVDRIEASDKPGVARVHAGDSFNAFDRVVPGEWRISLPVPGIAHRYGPGPCFEIQDNDTVTLEDVELWSAPWFGFNVSRNRGAVTFRRVNIRPKPGSGRLMSLWRDGFHVKGNSGSLLWEDCTVAGMCDDAFNISTHSSVVHRVLSPTRIQVRQKFPLLPIPWNEGASLVAVDEPAHRLLGSARVDEVTTGPAPPLIQGKPAAPLSILTLDAPIDALDVGTMVWDPAQCNPDTTLRRCRIRMSCRMQSPMRLEECDVEALLWFYAEHVEGGFPHHVTLENCVLRRGRGNPSLAVVFAGASDAAAPPRAIHDIVLRGNEIWGGLVLRGVERATVSGNRFLEPGAPITIRDNLDLTLEDNLDADGNLMQAQ